MNTKQKLTIWHLQELTNFYNRIELYEGSYGDIADEFILLAYESDLVLEGFNWKAWRVGEYWMKRADDTKYDMLDDEVFATKLITALVRQDRFAAGSIERWFELGVMQKILKKLISI